MAFHLVSYDLRSPGRDYSSLFKAIRTIANGYSHCLESVWVIGHAGPAVAIRDSLALHVDSNDKLFVVQLDEPWASYNFPANIVEWFNTHL